VHAEAVRSACTHSGQIAVPDLVCVFRQGDPL
jgi:hypothetical protein